MSNEPPNDRRALIAEYRTWTEGTRPHEMNERQSAGGNLQWAEPFVHYWNRAGIGEYGSPFGLRTRALMVEALGQDQGWLVRDNNAEMLHRAKQEVRNDSPTPA